MLSAWISAGMKSSREMRQGCEGWSLSNNSQAKALCCWSSCWGTRHQDETDGVLLTESATTPPSASEPQDSTRGGRGKEGGGPIGPS